MIEIVARNLYDDIEYLTGLGISIIPLKSVRNDSKNKDDYKKGLVANWTNQITSFTELQQDLKDGIVGYAIQTGQKSQIFVIDWDNKDINDKSNDFKQKLIDCNTLTINTAGGGHHFIFQYQGKLSNIKNISQFKNIGDSVTSGDYKVILWSKNYKFNTRNLTTHLNPSSNDY